VRGQQAEQKRLRGNAPVIAQFLGQCRDIAIRQCSKVFCRRLDAEPHCIEVRLPRRRIWWRAPFLGDCKVQECDFERASLSLSSQPSALRAACGRPLPRCRKPASCRWTDIYFSSVLSLFERDVLLGIQPFWYDLMNSRAQNSKRLLSGFAAARAIRPRRFSVSGSMPSRSCWRAILASSRARRRA
jgi:hypothetical protein